MHIIMEMILKLNHVNPHTKPDQHKHFPSFPTCLALNMSAFSNGTVAGLMQIETNLQ